jgi:hypothetical protein
MSVQISLFATTNKPQYWMDLYRSIGKNSISFEIVFVGPNEPDFILPSNFKYIKSNVKPAQCVEIASRNTSGELIMQIADDVEFKTKSPLDILYNSYKTYNDNELMVSCKYMLRGEDMSTRAHRFFYNDSSTPLMPVGMVLSKDTYRELGGMDRNFIAVHSELDMTMRLYATGGRVILSDVYINELRGSYVGGLCDEFWYHDRKVFEDLWAIDGKVQIVRARPFKPFSDEGILEESQGPKGRWH